MNVNISPCLKQKRVWVVFTNQTDLKFMRLFKRGFRHCFVLIYDGRRWVSIDPMANYMEVLVHDELPADFDFALWLKGQGYQVIEAHPVRNIMKVAPVMFFTCVEACKRFLGIHKFLIFTPWQLYRYLGKQS